LDISALQGDSALSEDEYHAVSSGPNEGAWNAIGGFAKAPRLSGFDPAGAAPERLGVRKHLALEMPNAGAWVNICISTGAQAGQFPGRFAARNH